MKLPFRLTLPALQRLVYSATSLLVGLAFMLSSLSALGQGVYATPGLYNYTVPAGGPYQIRVTARGADGGEVGNGGSGATIASTVTVQSGDVLTVIVGQSGRSTAKYSGGGGGGGSAVIVNRNGTRAVLVAAGGGGGGGSVTSPAFGTFMYPGGGGQGLGATNAGKGGITNPNDDNAGGGGGGGLAGPGSNGGGDTGGTGGGAASLTAVSAGGGVFHDTFQVNGGSGFGGGGSFAGDFGSIVARGVGGGGGGYGGGNGAISGSFTGADRDNPIYHATGGYSNVAISGTNTSVTQGTAGGSQNEDGSVTLALPQNTARATLSPDQSTCPGLFRTLQGTVSATGSWTLVLSDGTVATGSGTTFSIPVRPVTPTTYTIASLSDQRGFAQASNLTGQAVVMSNPGPTVSLTNNGLIGCSPYDVTLTASGGTSYTFSSGNTILPGDPASNIRVVHNPGDYSVLGIDGNGCVSSATTTVSQSTAPPKPYTFAPEGSVLTCSIPSKRIGVANLGDGTAIKSYTFVYGNIIIPGDPADPYRSVTSPGEYTVLVTGVNNCTASATQTITKANEVLPVVSLANNGPLTCAQSSVTLTATSDQSGPYTFTSGSTILDGPGSGNTRTVSSPGGYTVVVMGSNSCTNSATTTVTQVPQTPPTVSLTNNGPLSCAQSSVTLTAASNTATSYVFTNGGTPLAGDPASTTRTVSDPGTYTVVVSNANSCTNSATTTVIRTSFPIVVVNPATTFFVVGQAVSQAFTASGGVSPRSFSVVSGSLPPGLSLSVSGQLSGSPTQTGSFTAVIQATDANGCLDLGAPYEVNVTQPAVTGPAATYATPGLYTYTVPAGGPYRVWLTARGGDGGAESLGGTGSRVEGSYFVQSGDLLTVIVGQSGRPFSYGGGGGGGGSAIVLTHSGTQTLLVAAGGGGGGGLVNITPGGGGQGLGPSTGGVGGSSTYNYSGGGGGGGLDGPGGNGGSGFNPGGTGGGAASLTAPSSGGPYGSGTDGSGGSGFGGGGGMGGFDSLPGRLVGGGGGGYGGGHGGDNGAPVDGATGGYSYVSPAGSNTSVTPGIGGASRNREGIATIGFGQNTAAAAITTTNLAVCQGTTSTIEGTVSATGNWTLVLTNGLTATGSGTSFSIPVSPASPTTYTIESLFDDQGFAPVSNLSGQASVTAIKPVPTVSLTNNGPLTCTQPSVTLTASGATAYTFTTGSLPLAGDPASNTRVVTSPGTYSVVGVSPNGCTNSATTTVTSVATVTVVNPATTLFVMGQAVSQTFTASGGVAGSPDRPYSFSVVSGSLPPGLSLSADGQLSGSPTQTGSFTAVVQAKDANGCPGLGAPYEANVTQPIDMSLTATYTTPGLYTYTVPAGGPYRVWLTARGGDGGYYSIGGTGARVEGSYTVESGDLLTVMVGQRGKFGSGNDAGGGGTGGGGGGGSAVVLTHNGTQTLLVAAGGGGGGGRRYITPGGGGQGLGPGTGGAGGQNGISADGNYSGGGGGGGLNGPGGNGISGYSPGGTGGRAASLTALSAGGTYNNSTTDGFGGSGFGGGGALGGRDASPSRPIGGGGGGYGGGHGGDSVFPSNGGATGGYSYVNPAGSNTNVTPGISGISRDRDGIATIDFSQNTATAAITTTNLVLCEGSSANIEGTVNAKGNWTIVLSNGVVGSGSGTSFSIPVSTIDIVSGYPYLTIESLLDDQGYAPISNLSGQASVTVNPRPTVSLTNNGPLTCTQPSVTLTASGAASYTFTTGSLPLAGDPASNIRVVNSPGTYSVVGSLNGCTRSATTTVTSFAIAVVNPATTSFVVGQAVSQAFTASGGVAGPPDRPYSFSVVSGSLPLGLSLSTSGQLSGSPTQTGSFTAVIQATDANGCTGFGTSYVINVTSFSITSQPVASLLVCVGNPVSVTVGVSGTPTAYQWYKDNTLVSGQTSATLSLASASPADAGSYVVVITGGGQSLTSTAVSLTVQPSVPARYYVNASATGANTGLDWANAFTDLQSALQVGNACANNLKEIWVAGGVYKPTPTGDRTITFQLLSGVALYGGFVGNETTLSQRPPVNPNAGPGGASQPSSSTLSGDIGQPGNSLDNSQVVVVGTNLAPTTVLDGFVITGGRAEASAGPAGGGLTNVANSGNSSPTLTNLLFTNNYAASVGGAIFNYTNGNGAASPTISNCRFEQNTAGNGGAIANSSLNSRLVITNCFFRGNTATQWGGAIVNVSQGGTLSLVITNCAFQGNSATQGGAIWQATALASVLNALITNCSFSGNRAGEGGALYNATSIPGGAPAGGPIGLTLANSVLFDNGGGSTISNTGDVTLSARYNLLEASVTGYTDGGNNRTTASSPFASLTSLLLGAGSPAINAGDNGAYQTAGGPATDLGGNVRIQQTTIDLGAYETGDQIPCTPVAFTSPLASGSAVCVGGSVQVTGSLSGVPTSYQWYKDGAPLATQTSATLNLMGLQTTDTGTYALVVTDGCNPQAPISLTSTAFSLTVSATPTASILVPNGGTLSCAQPVLSLTATGGDTYRWEDNSTAAVRSVSTAGIYSVTATTSPGCSATATTTITSTTALITLTSPGQTTASVGVPFSQTFTATGGTGGPYSFSLASGSLPAGLSLSADGVLSGTPTQAGSFSVVVQAQDAGGCVGASAYTLLVSDTTPALTLADVSVSPALVCVGTSVTFTATVANVTGSYGYTLTNGTLTRTGSSTSAAFSQTLVASGSGLQTFTLTVSSAGQSATATTTLAVNPLPSATLSASNGGLLSCTQPSLTLTAGGGTTYAFGGPGVVSQVGNVAVVNAAGVYSVTVANPETGCSSLATTTVTSTTDSPSVSINASSTTLSCTSPSVNLTAVGTGGVRWSTGSTDAQISVTTAGTYSVTLTSPSGCTATASVVVNGDQQVPALSISPSSATLSCASPSATLTANGTGSFRWSTGSADAQISVTTAGTYSVTLTSPGGCTATTSAVVSGDQTAASVSISASSTALSCTSPTVSLTAVGTGSVRWSTGSTDAQISVSTAGTYSVTLTSPGGCTATASVVVSGDQQIPALSISPSSVTLSCASPSVSLTAVGIGSFRWDDNSTAAIRSVSTAGTYSVTVTSPGGCTATASVVVNEESGAPSVSINPTSATLSCANPSVNLTASGTGSFRWSTGSTDAQISVITAGTYSVTVTSPGGCTATASVVVSGDQVAASVSINASSTALSCASPTVSLMATGSGTFRWDDNSTAPIRSVSTAGTYSVTLTSPGGCTATASVRVSQDNSAPTASLVSSGTLSCGVTSVTLTASPDGQAGATLAYVFSAGARPIGSSNQAVVSASGVYSVTVLSGNGCSAVASTSVSQDTAVPAASLVSSGTLSCGVTSVTLTANPNGLSYVFSGGTNQIGTTNQAVVNSAGLYSVTVVSANGCSATVSVSVSQDNTAPVASLVSSGTLSCGVTSVTLTATPTGLSYVFSTGATQLGTTNQAVVSVAGLYSVTVLSGNGCSAVAQTSVTSSTAVVRVTLPTLTTATQGVAFSQAFTAEGGVAGPPDRPYTFSLVSGNVPPGLSLATTGVLAGTPTQAGSFTLTVGATDANGCSGVSLAYVLSVSEPVVAGTLRLVAPTYDCQSGAITFRSVGGDGSGTPVEYRAIGVTDWTTNPNQVVDLPVRQDANAQPLTLQARQNGVIVTYSFDFRLYCNSTVPNQPPVFTQPPTQTATVGQPFAYRIPDETFRGLNGTAVNFMAMNLPAGLSYSPDTRVISGVPTAVGSYSVTLSVSDPLSQSVSGVLVIQVNPVAQPPVSTTVNQAPVFNGPLAAQSGTVGQGFGYQLPAGVFTDPNTGDVLTYSAAGLPAGVQFTAASQTISGTPTTAGTYSVSLTATDRGGLSASGTLTITISASGTTPPTGAQPLAVIQPLYDCQTGAITFRTSGGDGSPIYFSSIGIVGYSTQTSYVVEAPIRNDANSQPLLIKATQSGVTTSYLFDFRLYCNSTVPTTPPVFNGPLPTQTGQVGISFSYQLLPNSFTALNGGTLNYVVTGLPAGLSFTAGSNLISGVPTQAGSVTATITATDPLNQSGQGALVFVIAPAATQPPVGAQPLSLVAPLYNCQTGAFIFQTSGGDGSVIEYFAVGITGYSSVAGPYTVRPAGDAQPFTLKARQSGVEVTYTWDFKAVCSGSSRVGVAEVAQTWTLRSVGNPITEELVVEVMGAAGQSLQLQLTDLSGHVVASRLIIPTSVQHREVFAVSRQGAGILILQAQSPTRRQTLKVLKL